MPFPQPADTYPGKDDVAAYLEAGVSDPDPTIVSVRSLGNPAVRASYEGSRLTLVASKDARGVQAGFQQKQDHHPFSQPTPDRMHTKGCRRS